jgi:hypothetical protein
MKTIYVLFNNDVANPICASFDRRTIEEQMLACFQEDFESQAFWDICGPYSLPRDYAQACEIVHEAYYDTLNWYQNWMEIYEIEVFN